jgi:hypothetical protein
MLFRDQADGEAVAEAVNWVHGTLRQIESVESNSAASQTDRRYRTGTSKQADADLYRDEAIDKTLLLVTGQSPRNCTQPLHHIKARSSQASDRPANRDRNVCSTYTSTRIATTTHSSSAAVRPAGSTRRCFRSCLALTLDASLELQDGTDLGSRAASATLASEVRSIGTAAWRAHEQLLRGTVADDELERLRPARFVPKRGQTALT